MSILCHFHQMELSLPGPVDGKIILWDIPARQPSATLDMGLAATLIGSWEGDYSLSFSPDGRSLAQSNNLGVTLWNVATGGHIATLPHGAAILSVSFSRNGILAAGSIDRTVKLWDVAIREHVATLPHNDSVESVAFSPDGGILASGGWGGLELWDVATKSRLATLMHGNFVYSVSFSADGETLASGEWDGAIKLWDMTTRENFTTFWATSTVYTVSFSPDGRTIASGTQEGTIELWDTSKLSEARLEATAEVDIPDTNLRAVIAEALGPSPNNSILRRHIQTLTGLYAENANITDLTGLEHAINLNTLILGPEYIEAEHQFVNSNSVSDLSPLAGLTKLGSLSLGDNDISDISALSGLISLKLLYLYRNSIFGYISGGGLNQSDVSVIWVQ